MSEFWTYFQVGLHHVLNINAYDHILFLIAMTVPYSFREWKKILILVTFFTVGHTLALLLSVLGIIAVKVNIVEFAIPITILFTALYNLFTSGKSTKNNSIGIIGFVTLFFGVIHGLGFSNYFKPLLSGSPQSKILPLSEFALGIESSQIIVVLVVLLFSYLVQTVFRFSKRDFALVLSSFVIGVVLPMIIGNEIWK
jgi:hypothetical protein